METYLEIIHGKFNRKQQPFFIPEIGRQPRSPQNFFARAKRNRHVNTRYGRLAETFTALVNLAALADWIRL